MLMRGVKFVVCVLLIVSVATILITPDQSDDVPGVLHHVVKIQKFLAVVASLTGVMRAIEHYSPTPFVFVREVDPPRLLTLLCVRLC
jgi:hypothetical protein